MSNAEADVVVVGFGTAGLTAAITAHDAGAKVIVLEKMSADLAGGNSRVSGQIWLSPHEPEMAKTYLREMAGEYPIADALVDAWAQETSRNTAWVRERAAEVRGEVPKDAGDPYEGDGTDISTRSYGEEMRSIGWWDSEEYEFFEVEGNECGTEWNLIGPNQGYSRLWLTLRAALDKRAIEVRYEIRATDLIQDVDGAVVGVLTKGPDQEMITFNARQGVILATGGFAASSEMARNFLRLSYVTPWGSPGNTGDGIKLAQKVGADLAHPYNYMGMPGIARPPFETGEFVQPEDGRFIYVAADGRRFVNELSDVRHGKTRVRGMFDFYPGVPMWTIFDEDGRLAGPIARPRENLAIGWPKQIEGYEWSSDNRAEIERGWIVEAPTLRELAQKLEIDPDGLELEVETYNASCEQGQDAALGRPGASMRAIGRGPYYGYRWAQLLITTLGGIRKDENARATDPDGNPVPGLYCAGDVTSTYTWALGGGMGLADAMAFARIAARHAVSRTHIGITGDPAAVV
jgi:succinate dehydrogenase/fumarate reductase flavoprotein subunit